MKRFSAASSQHDKREEASAAAAGCPSPEDELWWRVVEEEGAVAGFTWRGRHGTNDFRLPADGARWPWRGLLERTRAWAIVQGEQVHGAQVSALTAGPLREALVVPGVDGVILTVPEVLALVRVADCVPVLMWAPGKAVAAVHAGWRGLAAGIIGAAVDQLRRVGVEPSRLRASIGPAVGACCYTIGEEVAGRLSRLPGGPEHVRREGEDWRADLGGLAVACLVAAGVPAGNIQRESACTAHCREYFFSYRRDGERAGRQVGAVLLRSSR